MRRFVFRFAIAFLTFTIGLAAASVWFVSRRPNQKPISVVENQPAQSTVENRRTYESGMHASGMSGSHRACWSGFSSSDGMHFSSTSIYFNSPKRANRELQTRLKTAIKILKREPILDEGGHKIGERVVATFAPYKGSSVASAALISVKGSDFGSIESSSLRNILEYEKDHQR